MAQLDYYSRGEQRLFGYFQSTGTALGTTGWIDPDYGSPVVVMIPYLTGGETVAIYGTHDGTNFEAALKPKIITTGQPVAATALVVGTYILDQNYREYKFVKSAGVQNGVVAWFIESIPKHGSQPVNLNLPQYV